MTYLRSSTAGHIIQDERVSVADWISALVDLVTEEKCKKKRLSINPSPTCMYRMFQKELCNFEKRM
jgi:hypothetical protein